MFLRCDMGSSCRHGWWGSGIGGRWNPGGTRSGTQTCCHGRWLGIRHHSGRVKGCRGLDTGSDCLRSHLDTWEKTEVEMIRKQGTFWVKIMGTIIQTKGDWEEGGEEGGSESFPAQEKSHWSATGTACCSSVSLWIRLPQNLENTFCWDNRRHKIV